MFVLIAFFSVFWSISVSESTYRFAGLLFSSLIGAYLGVRYSTSELVDILIRFGMALLVVCAILAIFLPVAGTMMFEPYNGSWRGVFWHRNHLGGIAVLFNVIFLIALLGTDIKDKSRLVFNVAAYLFSAVIVYFAKSVAGYVLFVLMNFLVFLAFFWLKIRHRLKSIHYYGALGLSVSALAVILLNLDFVFGLVGRDSTLTGRSFLWAYLIHDVIARSPWFGYGFGAIWSFASFRMSTQHILGWGFPVVIADNGFLDILLHVGLAGLIPFLGVLLVAFLRFSRHALQQRSLLAFFPMLVLVFALCANISFSFFLEVETFVWLLLIAVLFRVTLEKQTTSS